MSPQPAHLVSIVDDDPFVLAATSSLVRSLGWEARSFSSPFQFLASGDLARTGCLVCDIQMPEMNGLELLGRLKRQGVQMPTVFITAFATHRVKEEALERGGLCLIEKPIDATELENRIREALSGD